MTIKQYIVVNRELNMTRGKLMAQAAHASLAFLTTQMQNAANVEYKEDDTVEIRLSVPSNIYDGWICGLFTKIALAVDGQEAMQDVYDAAIANGLVEGRDFFCIRDACLTELTPDETGTCLTCIGFAPCEADILKPVVGELPLFR